MNLSLPEIETFLNASQEAPYKVDESTKSCVLIIGPLVKLLQEYIYNSILTSGSFVMDGLRAHYDFYNPAVIKEGFGFTVNHMVLGYALILAGLVALILLPITCCMKFCSKSSINLYRYQICFCAEGFIFILASVAVFLSAVSSLQTVVHVDEALQSHPELARNIIDDLRSYQNNMQIQLIHLKHDLDMVLEFNLNLITDFPDKATSIAQESFLPVISKAGVTFTQIYGKFQATCKETDIESCNDPQIKLKLMNALPNVGVDLNGVRRELEDLRQKVLVDFKIYASEREHLASNIFSIQQDGSLAYFSAENMLNWTFLYKEVYHVLDDLAFANTSVHFLQNMTENISSFLQPTAKKLTAQSLELKSWSNSSLIDFTSISEKLLPNESLERIKKQMHQIDQVLTYLDVTSNSNFAVFSGRAFLVLAPGLHSLILLLILSTATICGVHEINELNRTGSESAIPRKRPSFGAKIMHCGTLFGLSLLWLNFFLAGLSYLTAMLMSMMCLPVVDSTIFKNYIDNPQVWDGYTWIDTQMRDVVNNSQGHIKMEDVVEHCGHNQSIYDAFGMDQFWNITEKLKIDSVKINYTEFQLQVKRGVTSVNVPDFMIIEKISKKMNYISEILDMVFEPKFVAEIKMLQDINATKTLIQTLLSSFGENDSKYRYIESSLEKILTIMSRIENQPVTESIAKLAVLKSGMSELQLKVSAVAFDLLDVNSTMYTTVIPQVNNQANISINLANNITLSYARNAELKLRTEVGNCHVLYNLYRKSKWAVCENGLTLINAVWISHGMMAVSMAVLLLLSCRIASYLRGAHRAQIHWQQRLELRRHERQIDKALMYGGQGKYVGNAVMLRDRGRSPHANVVAVESDEIQRK